MEGLNVALKELPDRLIKGAGIGNPVIRMSHLFYVDDVIFYVLNEFYLASGMKLNIDKSNIYGIGVEAEELKSMVKSTGLYRGCYLLNTLAFLYRFKYGP